MLTLSAMTPSSWESTTHLCLHRPPASVPEALAFSSGALPVLFITVLKGTPTGLIFQFSNKVMCGYGLFTPGAQGTSPLWHYFYFLMFL
jgi:hypothetical protein